MGWKNSREDAASRGGFVSLKDDGDSVDFIPVTEPEPTEKDGVKAGTRRTVYRVGVVVVPVKHGCNVPNLDLGVFAFNTYEAVVGPGHECKSVIRMTRHGAKGDTNTRYAFKILRKAKASEAKEAKAALKDSSAF